MKTSSLCFALAMLPWSLFASDVTGTWKSDFDSQIGQQNYTFTLKQEGTKLTGKANSEAGDRKREAELKEGKVEGDAVSFVEMLTIQDNEIRISYAGKLSADGNEIKFTREVGEFAKAEIVARREPTASSRRHLRRRPSASRPESLSPLRTLKAMSGWPTRASKAAQTLERSSTSRLPNTKSPDLYRAERYSMDSFSWPVPNGNYVVKLSFRGNLRRHYRPRTARVFLQRPRARVQGFRRLGQGRRAVARYVETVEVEVTDGFSKSPLLPRSRTRKSTRLRSFRRQRPTAVRHSTPAATAVAAVTPAATRRHQRQPLPAPAAIPVLQIDAGKVTGTVSPTLYGLMTEEINFSYEGGIYGELIRNRTFKANRAESACSGVPSATRRSRSTRTSRSMPR